MLWKKIRILLPVSACNDSRVGTLGVSQREQPLGLVDSRPAGALGQGVGSQVRDVWPTNSLYPDLRVAILSFKRVRNGGARTPSLICFSESEEPVSEISMGSGLPYFPAR